MKAFRLLSSDNVFCAYRNSRPRAGIVRIVFDRYRITIKTAWIINTKKSPTMQK